MWSAVESLSTMKPAQITETSPSPSAIPVSGWLAVAGGGLGLPLGLLEEWRRGGLSGDKKPADR